MSFFINRGHRGKYASKRRVGKTGYQPNLVSLMTLCASNYMLLLKVLANNVELGATRSFFINENLSYLTCVNEVTRYTSLITLEQKLPINSVNTTLAKIITPKMTVRLYHDARMAELLSSQGITQVKPRYDYPNKYMHQQDEKHQLNQFLNEWLHLCLELGQVSVQSSY